VDEELDSQASHFHVHRYRSGRQVLWIKIDTHAACSYFRTKKIRDWMTLIFSGQLPWIEEVCLIKVRGIRLRRCAQP
jgi:hypothetical protein